MTHCPMPLCNGKLALEEIKHGVVSFVFDDGHYHNWLKHLELFQNFNARCTFHYNREITPEAAESMKILRSYGHSVGLHSVSHRDVEPGTDMVEYYDTQIAPQLASAAACGVENIRYFGYPNNRHTPESDEFLGKYFARLRTGLGLKLPKGFRIAEQDKAFMELDELASTRVLGGFCIGEYYGSTEENLHSALSRAAAENKFILFTSHDISPGAKSVHMPTELLEYLLKTAAELQIAVAGFDELPE